MSFQFFTIGSALFPCCVPGMICTLYKVFMYPLSWQPCNFSHIPDGDLSEPQCCQTLDPGLSAGRALPRGTTADSGSLCTVED